MYMYYLCGMRYIVAIEDDGMSATLYKTKQDAAFAARMERIPFHRLIERDGFVDVGGIRYVYPTVV